MEEKGFYKFDQEISEIYFGTKIYGAYGAYNFFLDTLNEDKTGCVQEDGSTIYFPHDGWYYFASRQEAENFFGVNND